MNLSEKLTCSVVAFFATVRKNRTVEENMIRTSVENMKAVKEITQFMTDNDLSKEQIIFVINEMTNLVDKNPHSYFSRENIEYLKQKIIQNYIKND